MSDKVSGVAGLPFGAAPLLGVVWLVLFCAWLTVLILWLRQLMRWGEAYRKYENAYREYQQSCGECQKADGQLSEDLRLIQERLHKENQRFGVTLQYLRHFELGIRKCEKFFCHGVRSGEISSVDLSHSAIPCNTRRFSRLKNLLNLRIGKFGIDGRFHKRVATTPNL